MKKRHYLLKHITLICACFALIFGGGGGYAVLKQPR
jgi:hypothetical protein